MCKFLIPSTYPHNIKQQQKHYYHVGKDIENVVVFVDEYSLFDGKEIKNSSDVWKGQNKKFAGALYISLTRSNNTYILFNNDKLYDRAVEIKQEIEEIINS